MRYKKLTHTLRNCNDTETVLEAVLEAIASQLNQLSHHRVYIISAVTRTELDKMMREIWRILDEINAVQTEIAIGV